MQTRRHLDFRRGILQILGIALLFFWSCGEKPIPPPAVTAPFLHTDVPWIDSMLIELPLEAKLGQLLYWQGDSLANEALTDWVAQGLIGGMQLPGLNLEAYLQLTDSLRDISQLPLFFGTEEPAVLFNHFSDLAVFPQPMTLGSIAADSIEMQLTALYAAQCQAVGINLVQAPQMGTYQIKDTSFTPTFFSDDKSIVTQRAAHLTHALLAQRILPIGQSIEMVLPPTADSLELERVFGPFCYLVQQGICGWVIDPEVYPLDTVGYESSPLIKSYLQKQIGFDGLVLSTAKDTAELREQLFSGSDVLKINDSPHKYIAAMKTWLELGVWSESDLHLRLERLWKAKSWMNTSRDSLDYAAEIEQWLAHDHYELMAEELYHQSLTIPNDPKCLLPLQDIHHQRIVILTVGQEPLKVFPEYVEKYAEIRNQFFRSSDFSAFPDRAWYRAKRSTVFFVLDQVTLDTARHRKMISAIDQLAEKTRVILINFGNPNLLNYFAETVSMVQLYERNELTEALAAQVIFGGVSIKGRLPVTIADHMPRGLQQEREIIRVSYGSPELAGVESYRLSGIDAIMQQAIRSRTTPGGQVFVIKSGKVIYDKSFGYHTYRKKQRAQKNDLYDLASVTKVAATTLGIMRLYEQGRIRLKDKLRKHIPETEEEGIGNITVEQLLTHRSGLSPNMPIADFISSRKRKRSWFECNEYYCQSSGSEPYTLEIADSVFLDPRWIDSIWQDVYHMRVSRYKRVRYSDVNFNLLQKLVETESKSSLDQYLLKTIYRPLHLRHTTYRPLDHFKKYQIIPTAKDNVWRNQLVHGYVHDESAALFGGIAGNAGLFSNARDLGILFQMVLNGGSYGGQQFFQPQTISTFAQTKSNNRRAYGFERKTQSTLRGCSPKASRSTYGHTGFTGSAIWIDPEHELVFVFLANRVHPNPRNGRIFRKKIRGRVHSVVYDALDTYQRPPLPEWRVQPILPLIRLVEEETEALQASR